MILKILVGAALLILVLGLYVLATYFRNKNIHDSNTGCNGNCASCGRNRNCDDAK